jgi:mono/diheme cytochrome c family protein
MEKFADGPSALREIFLEPLAAFRRLMGDRLNQQHQTFMNPTKIALAALAAAFTITVAVRAAEVKLPPASEKKDVTYATDIKPIFDANCAKCHMGDRAKAKLHMDSLEGILKGTKAGKIVTVGDSANSFIVKSIAHATEEQDEWMPPVPNKAGAKTLTAEQVGLVRAWIDQGAK